MAQKVVLKLFSMTDEKVKQKAIEAAADIHGVDSIAAELKSQELMVVGDMDTVAVVKKLKKVAGIVDILSVGPIAIEEPPPPLRNKKKKRKKKKQYHKLKLKEEMEHDDDYDDEDLLDF